MAQIHWACPQCGKHHSRADSQCGTLIFCTCGHGNRVPWTSSVAAPPAEPEPPATASPPPPPRVPAYPDAEPLRPRSWRGRRNPNPTYCLHHEETPSNAICAMCECSFCSACVVVMQGQTLCAPCKNFRVRQLSRPPRVAALAIIAFILALVFILGSLFLNLLAVGLALDADSSKFAALLVCLLALFWAVIEALLGWVALRQIDRNPLLGGHALALTGTMAGLVGIVWSLAIAVFSIAKHYAS